MSTEDILKAIVSGAGNAELARRAAKELGKKRHEQLPLLNIYRDALSCPGSRYSAEAIAAMRAADERYASAQSYNRTTSIRFRCTEVEKKVIESRADAVGKTVSDYVRDAALG